MPRGDGMGPMGMDPMTVKAAGFCAGFATAGFMNPIAGRGICRGFGRGRGNGRGSGWRYGWAGAVSPTAATAVPYPPPLDTQSEATILKNRAKYLGEALEGINRRITELEA